jgi:hypothetical protein
VGANNLINQTTKTTNTMQTGITYTTTGERNRDTICGYHQSPFPHFLNKTAFKSDIQALKRPALKSLNFDGREWVSKFTIGFEVEKNQLSRGAVKEYELLKGFERDGSCGYEAITHVLPLLPAGTWRTKVFDMIHKAERIIDDRYSPSDEKDYDGNYKCGGHITLGVVGMSGKDLMDATRNYSGILYAMFRNRLQNKYCRENNRMEWSHYGNRYQVCLKKDNTIEFRLPSKIESVKQMMRRYELCYELLDYAVNVKGTFPAFLKRITPLVVSMYNGNEAKAKIILGLAVEFQDYINTGVKPEIVRTFIPYGL